MRYDDRETRETIPAMPVPSENRTAEERKKLEGDKFEQRVAIVQPRPETNPDMWRGLTIVDGVAKFYTPDLTKEEGERWLAAAKKKARDPFNWIPTICTRCFYPRMTPSICDECSRR